MPAFNDPSGTVDFQQTRDQLIARSLRQCSAIADGETPSNSMIADACVALNAMVKQWNATGIHLFTETEGALFLQPSQRRYQLDPRNSADHAAQDWCLSSTSNAYAAGATALALGTINSNYGKSDISIGDRIGITLSSGTIHWTGVTYPWPNITIQDALPSDVGAGAAVFVYTQLIAQPLRIAAARRLQISGMIEIPLIPLSRLDFRDMPNKDVTGTVTQFFYDPQLISGFLYTWPAPLDAASVILFTWHRRIKDFNAATDVPDLPQEWLNCLAWNLAREIAPEYDVPAARYQIISMRALETLDVCSGFDKEPESIFFSPAFEPSSR